MTTVQLTALKQIRDVAATVQAREADVAERERDLAEREKKMENQLSEYGKIVTRIQDHLETIDKRIESREANLMVMMRTAVSALKRNDSAKRCRRCSSDSEEDDSDDDDEEEENEDDEDDDFDSEDEEEDEE